jgi:chromate reductase, NAD(P)H dehydrogenase (quinone)
LVNQFKKNMKIIAFSGSLRKASLNRALLKAAIDLRTDNMQIETFDLKDIPLYNGDVEAEATPEIVRSFKDAIRKADGILIATPEYNHGMPGVLKNAIDWASRPGEEKSVSISGKPVGIMGASPGILGTARSQDQLRHTLKALNAFCMPKPEVLLFKAKDKIDDSGKLTDEATIEFLQKFMQAFEKWVKTFSS